MSPLIGRGSPEMDIFEVQPGDVKSGTGPFYESAVGQPFQSASFQVAPGRPVNRPGPGWWPGPTQWYEGLQGGANTSLNILFYGNYNHFLDDVHPARQDYWSDAISMNRQLSKDHFTKPHDFRLEWDVPSNTTDGYLHWFLDGDLVFSINGTGIRNAGLGSEISSEPSYIIMNTAISKQWGFPLECPASCPCKEYDCNSDIWEETCGFSSGFCDMIAEKPQYKIDWVRVYQDPDDSKQKVGCSTPERPSRQYIEAHDTLYKTTKDDHPLQPIQIGRGQCDPKAVGVKPESCGGNERGICSHGKVCECQPGWTGPHCLAHAGIDPILYDQPDQITDIGFILPRFSYNFLFLAFVTLVFLFSVMLQSKVRHHLEGWRPVPDVEMSA
jgi:hypothetical protein